MAPTLAGSLFAWSIGRDTVFALGPALVFFLLAITYLAALYCSVGLPTWLNKQFRA